MKTPTARWRSSGRTLRIAHRIAAPLARHDANPAARAMSPTSITAWNGLGFQPVAS
jgi:hypothetical protein